MTEAFELWRAWSSNASANGRCLNCRVRKSASNFSGILSAAFHRVIVGGPEDAYLLLKQRGAPEDCHIRSRFDPLNGTFVPLWRR